VVDPTPRPSPSSPTDTPSSARAMRLALAMLSAKGHAEAARSAGMSRRAAFALRQTPGFKRIYQRAADEVFEQTINGLRAQAVAATSVLASIAADPAQPGQARCRAAEVALSLLLKATETGDVLKRLAALERDAEKRQNPNHLLNGQVSGNIPS
jgi:hypothetical protein